MLHIGCHLSISKGFEHIGREAQSIKADTFQFFTRNPQGGKAKDISESDVAKFRKLAKEYSFAPLVAHAPYTLNPCSDNPKTREFAEMVERRSGLEVVFWDERLTTVASERVLMEGGVRRENRKAVIDQMAAVLILQGYLDSLSMRKQME